MYDDAYIASFAREKFLYGWLKLLFGLIQLKIRVRVS